MIDFFKKFFEKAGCFLLGIIVVAIALFSVFLGLGSAAKIIVDIVKIAGGGSLLQGIITTPFFIFGVIQLIRGFCSTFDSDLKKMDTKDDSIWNYFYIPATVLGYIAVFLVILFWGKSMS